MNCSSPKSGNNTVEWVLEGIYFHHEGRLFRPDGQLIYMDHTSLEDVFGEDGGWEMDQCVQALGHHTSQAENSNAMRAARHVAGYR